MPDTLPSLTETINDQFVETWYTIRPDAIDNILDENVIWAALREMGCFKKQVGGRFIERTIGYGSMEGSATAVDSNSTLPSGIVDLETAAFWTWRYVAQPVQYNLMEVQQNAGPDKIKDLVAKRLKAARDGLAQKFEADLERAVVTGETGLEIQGLNDMLPPNASKTTGTYGKINRANSYWIGKYLQLTSPVAQNLLDNMRTLYNTISNNQQPPKLIITTQTLFETYEDFGENKVQIIKDTGGRLLDLGFEVLRFKGKMLIWSPNVTASTMKMVNTDFIDVVYDPNMWFEMTQWKPVPLQPTMIAHIICALNVVSPQLRRHGLLYA